MAGRFARVNLRMEPGRFATSVLGSRNCYALFMERESIAFALFVESDEPGVFVEWRRIARAHGRRVPN